MKSILATTDRLYLRPLHLGDTDFFCGLFNNPEVMKYYDFVRNEEQTRVWIEFNFQHYERFGFGKWVIVRKEDDIPLGHTGLILTEIDGVMEVELGYFLDNRAWGKGYATEAANASLSLAFDRFGLKRVVSAMNPSNLPSIKVAERLGMQMEKSGQAKVGDYTWRCLVYAKDQINENAKLRM